MKVSQILLSSIVIIALIAVIGLAGGLLVLLAYAVGLLINQVMHFEPFQITALCLVGIIIAGWLTINLANGYLDSKKNDSFNDDDDYDDDYDDEEDDEDEDVIVEDRYPGIPLWRQPRKQVDFSNTRPDDRCPCGSGRKYKNCHGAGQTPPKK